MFLKKYLLFSILLFIVFADLSLAIEGAEFAIYSNDDEGTWKDGIVAFEQFLEWKSITFERVSPSDINTVKLADFYEAIYFPGGDADYFNEAIDQKGIQHIKELVNAGGGYIGMCAGAEFACDRLVWDGYTIDYPLDFFVGRAVGPIDAIAVWPEYAMTTLSMNLTNPINQFEPDSEVMLYYGGCAMYPDSGMLFDTVATFDALNDDNAIINFHYGNGRVLLIAPHPEIEEDSDRDKTDVAEELDDAGSDWPFLWSAVDWLLGDSITDPDNTLISNDSQTQTGKTNSHINNYLNPFNSSTTIEYTVVKTNRIQLEIYTLTGQLVERLINEVRTPGEYSVTWDGKSERHVMVSGGIYFYVLKSGNREHVSQRIILLK